MVQAGLQASTLTVTMAFRLRGLAMNSEALSFGYSSLKKEQKDFISDFILGNDVFPVLPTGFGKSLCYDGNVLTGICI